MPLIADYTATVTNRFYDGDTDADATTATALSGVSWAGKLVASAGESGLTGASLYQMRIFAGSSTAQPQGASNAVAAEDTYLTPAAWAASDVSARAAHWTLRPGDTVSCGGVDATILAVHDNRGNRRFPHWYVEAR